MGQNRGKQFEDVVKSCFEKVKGVSIDRLHDQTTGFKGSKNICDFIVYRYPFEVYIECKTHYGNTLPFTCITDNQWNCMLEKIKCPGVFAGVLCWFIDHNQTVFIPIQILEHLRNKGNKSFHIKKDSFGNCYEIPGVKKRVFFDYDMEQLLDFLKGVRI